MAGGAYESDGEGADFGGDLGDVDEFAVDAESNVEVVWLWFAVDVGGARSSGGDEEESNGDGSGGAESKCSGGFAVGVEEGDVVFEACSAVGESLDGGAELRCPVGECLVIVGVFVFFG